ncbi:hypothetical protein LXL04_018454 [Taraxacum kok-saghyz]
MVAKLGLAGVSGGADEVDGEVVGGDETGEVEELVEMALYDKSGLLTIADNSIFSCSILRQRYEDTNIARNKMECHKYQKCKTKERKPWDIPKFEKGIRNTKKYKEMRNELSAILDKFRTVLPLALPGGEGITNNFGAVLDLFAPVTSSRTMAFEEMMSRFLEKHFDRFTPVSYLLRHCAHCSGKMTTNDSQTWYHIEMFTHTQLVFVCISFSYGGELWFRDDEDDDVKQGGKGKAGRSGLVEASPKGSLSLAKPHPAASPSSSLCKPSSPSLNAQRSR